MQGPPLFSILIPAYKSKFLKVCIESVLSQSYQNFEVIIVDDFSPFDIEGIVTLFDDKRISYFRNSKNCGAENVVDNWNICLSHASGEYVICMGDDDMLDNKCLETYAKLMDKFPGLDVYHAWTMLIDENGRAIGMQEPRPKFEGVYSMMYNRWNYARRQYIGDWAIRREPLVARGGYHKLPFAWGSDDFSVLLAAENKGVANTQTPTFYYRVNSETISRQGRYLEKFCATSEFIRQIELHFLKTKPIHLNKIESFYYDLCKSTLQGYLKKRQNNDILGSILTKGKFYGLIWWLIHCKEYGITRSRLLKIWVRTLNKSHL